MDAVRFAYSVDGKAAKIGVLNLSLAAKFDPTSSTYQQDLAAVCTVFKEASDAGILITAAAGNYAASMRGYVPASCPTVLAVASIDADSNTVSGFSNYLPSDATTAERSMMIAAPGANILSTMSFKKDPTGYKMLSGTSMASPHIAGVAAACVMSGTCAAGTSGSAKIATLQAAAQERLSMGDSGASTKYAFTGVTGGNFYGQLVWSKW
eukprot:GHUV01039682.1.p1 GENE.GHUV01039682.1~~GHUV01039682.1.p1  ORF type:complete len:240 (-),score=33.06 GHUV01039682.1:174-800(-)